MIDIDKLSEENWLDEAIKIYSSLKPEIQDSNGLLKKLRKLNEESSFLEKLNARKNFLDKDIRMLDDSVNQYISALYTINARNLNRLNFDFLQVLRLADLGDCPNLSVVIDTLNSKNYHGLLGERICLILAKIANESFGQSQKSNAGLAIQETVRCILEKLEFRLGIDFREKYRSKENVEVNFVFPAVVDNSDKDIELALACQMSSNDRIKLASEQLTIGKQKFIFTGNGLEVSNMKLCNISDPIINRLYEKNIMLICHGNAISEEINRLQNSKKDRQLRLKYFKNKSFSFFDFTKIIQKFIKV